jgi:hypothetical protein
MSDQATFWFWIVVLAVTCLFLGAVLASSAGAHGGHGACYWVVENQPCRTETSRSLASAGLTQPNNRWWGTP